MSAIPTAIGSKPMSPEVLYRDMLDRLPVAAYACDSEGLITYFNAKAEEIWGRALRLNHEDDRFCGSWRLFSVDGSPIAHDECWMAQALLHRRDYLAQEILIERPNAAMIPVLAYASPLIDADGELVAGINMLVDIRDRKRMEQLLRSANETKNQYMATLADELRVQLDAMRGSLERVERDLVAADADLDSVQVIRDRIVEMNNLVEDLLDRPRSPAPPAAVSLAPLVEAAELE